MKVVIFQEVAPDPLEARINSWLNDHKNVATHAIIQNTVPGKEGKPDKVLVTLWYSEITGPPSGAGHGPGSVILAPRGFRPGRG